MNIRTMLALMVLCAVSAIQAGKYDDKFESKKEKDEHFEWRRKTLNKAIEIRNRRALFYGDSAKIVVKAFYGEGEKAEQPKEKTEQPKVKAKKPKRKAKQSKENTVAALENSPLMDFATLAEMPTPERNNLRK